MFILKKIWDFLKAVPAKVWLVLLLLGAVFAWWLEKKQFMELRIEYAKERLRLEREREAALIEAKNATQAAVDAIIAKYSKLLAELEDKRKEIESRPPKTPKEIADEWNKRYHS